MSKTLYTTFASLVIASLAIGCASIANLTEKGAQLAAKTGVISAQHADSLAKSSKAIAKAAEDITPEQEYYIGRSVGALILKSYKAYDNKQLNQYLNTMGQALAAASDKPETYGGYHFLVLDTDEINGFAAPGGLIFVSRGLLRCCKSEDDLAAILAHEIGHVQHGHGLNAIDKSRLTSALTTLGAEAAKSFGPEQVGELTTAFEGSLKDIMSTMVTSGYARKYETQADATAVTLLKRIGYDPNGLKRVLKTISAHQKPDDKGFAKTHPDPNVRIKDIEPLLQDHKASPAPAARTKRFKKALTNV